MNFKEAEALQAKLTTFLFDVLPQVQNAQDLKNPAKGLINEIAAVIMP